MIPSSAFYRNYWQNKSDGGHRSSDEQFLKREADSFFFHFSPGSVFLDVGCGGAEITTYLAPHFKVVLATDFSFTMLEAAKKRLNRLKIENTHLFLSQATRVPLQADLCDVVFSSGIAQYLNLNEIELYLNECNRVICKKGIIMIADIPDISFRWNFRLGFFSDRKTSCLLIAGRLIKYIINLALSSFLKSNIPDKIGIWHSRQSFMDLAHKCNLQILIVNSLMYEYRFHAILRRK